MAYKKVDDTSLSSVADAIRAKGGTSDALVFPEGFVSAISAIQTGGGGALLVKVDGTTLKIENPVVTDGTLSLASISVKDGILTIGG